MSIEVTIRDTETGESQTGTIVDDYIVIVAGTCHVATTQMYANGTHVLTIKGRQS